MSTFTATGSWDPHFRPIFEELHSRHAIVLVHTVDYSRPSLGHQAGIITEPSRFVHRLSRKYSPLRHHNGQLSSSDTLKVVRLLRPSYASHPRKFGK